MKVRLRGRKGTYTATKAVVGGWSTDVFIKELGQYVNSVEIVGFDLEIKVACKYFDEHPKEKSYGIFIRDY